MQRARDWEVFCDLPWERAPGSVFTFPGVAAFTALKPDIVVISNTAKFCICGPELTAPMEENVKKWRKEKSAKYSDELTANAAPDWKFSVCTVEVGARGWVPNSFRNDLRRIFGFSKSDLTNLENTCSLVARKCSYLIWINRFNKDFAPFPLLRNSEPTLTNCFP
jgi:hypothetical protein